MSSLSLRSYQEEGIRLVYESFRKGFKRVIFWLATGGGKTFTFCSIINDTVNGGNYVVLVVKRRDLIGQASKNLDKWKIRHGVYMSNHKRYRPSEMVQICSIDTLDARNLYPHNDKCPLVICDESHDIRPTGKKYVKFLDAYPNSPVIGFTATPYGNNGLFDDIVKPIDAHELMMQGNLTPVRMYVPEGQIDTSNVDIKNNGEFNDKQLFAEASRSEVVGDFVRDWNLYSKGRPTVLFAVNVEHSKIIAKAFNDAGISAVHADANTKTEERDRALRDLKSGKVQVLCNVNIFSTGVDLPEIACIQLCRPTQSLIWYIQAVGRGLRPSPETGKTNCIIIDNAGNTFRFGSPYRVHTASIEKQPRRDPDEEDLTIRSCKRCHFVFEANQKICPECEFVNPPVDRKINNVKGDLQEYNMTPEEREMMDKGLIVADCFKLKGVAKRRKFKKDWIFYSLKEKYGVDKMATFEQIILGILEDYE